MNVRSTLRCCQGVLSTISLLFLLSSHRSFVAADYVIMLKDQVLHNPNNTDAQGNCCNDTEGTGNCITPCDVNVYICIRPSGFDSLNRSNCPILSLSSSIESNQNLFITRPWTGGVQILLTIEDMDEDLVDMFLIELNGTATASNESVSATTMQYTGLSGIATLEISTAVSCVSGFYGPSCDCQGRDDDTGHFTCNGAGERVCLQGHQNLTTNCTECVPAEGCSPVGGFCELPGECTCREGYSGNNCATGPLSSPSEGLLLPFSTLLLLEPFATPSVSTATMMSSLVMTSFPAMISSSALPLSPRVESSPATISSSVLEVDDVASSTVLPLPSSSAQPPTTSLAATTALLPSLLSLSPTPLPFVSSRSPQPTTTSSSTTPLPPASSPQVGNARPSTQPSSESQPSSSMTGPTAAESSSIILTTSEGFTSSRSVDLTSTSSLPGSLPVTPSSTNGMVFSPPPLTPTPSTATSPPTPRSSSSSSGMVATPTGGGQGGEGAGNVGAIVGAVMLIVAVLVLILIFVICIYVKMTNRKKRKQQRSMFLDQVYNTPVMFVNPEGAIPRSPQLIMQGGGEIGLGGGQEVGGGGGGGGGGGADFVGDPEPRALDVTNKGPFPDIAYKAHEPYAERGPSREPSSSDENSHFYQLSEADSTVFVNPSTEQPHPLPRPEDSTQQRRSGLGFDYRDDPIGDAYLTDQYQEQALDVGGQSNGHMSTLNSGRGHMMAYGSGRGYTSGHQNGNHSKYTNGQPYTATHRPMPLAPPPLPRPRKPREGTSPKILGQKYGGQGVEETEQIKVEQERKSSAEGGQGERKQKEGKEERKENKVVEGKREEKGKVRGEEKVVEEKREEKGRGRREEEEEEGDSIQQRAVQYLQVAQEQSEKRQSYMQDILFTDINLDMSTQTEL